MTTLGLRGWLSCLSGSRASGVLFFPRRTSDTVPAQEPGCVSSPMPPCYCLVVVLAFSAGDQKVWSLSLHSAKAR